ncbi:MAG: phosphotransferase [Pseudomonadota bacterium]
MNQDDAIWICEATGAREITHVDHLQSLWSGYGQLMRCELARSSTLPRVIVKRVRWPDSASHPRGWSTDRSHQRKARSYEVETEWYARFAPRCTDGCRVPRCIAAAQRDDGIILILEDLDAAGFDQRRSQPNAKELLACIRWLATFHATFMGVPPDGLWPTGTYWHLATRPDEWSQLADPELKAAAPLIDQRLSNARFQTLVHGDAKVANFCFSDSGRAAAVDFQYVGGGCGMKDLAYLISSCLSEDDCEQQESQLLDAYFDAIRTALETRESAIDAGELEAEWRPLYAMAWTDFFRFLQGWSPGHWKIHRYSRRLARDVLATL